MQLFRQIFFDTEVVLGFISSIAVFLYNISSFPKAIASIDPTKNKSKRFNNEHYRFEQFGMEIAKRAGLQFLVCCIIFVFMMLDGISRTDLIGILVWPIVILLFPVTFCLTAYFNRLEKQYKILPSGYRSGSTSYWFSFILGGSSVSSIAFTTYVLWSYHFMR